MQNVVMLMPPIEITEQAIKIPQHYQNTEFVVELVDNFFVIRPKPNGLNGHVHKPSSIQHQDFPDAIDHISPPEDEIDLQEYAELKKRYPWIGSAKGLPTDLSVRVKEILAADIDPRSGWTTKEPLQD